MRAVIHLGNRAPHRREHTSAMAQGLAKHGVQVVIGGPYADPGDVSIVWGARQTRILESGVPVLIIERGHVGDRMRYSSLGWGGLGRRGRYPAAPDGGARWREHWGHLMQPWQHREGYALILGQVDGDAALRGLDVVAWAGEVGAELLGRGWEVRFRPHPLAERKAPAGIPVTDGQSFEADLRGAGLCVSFNSTAGVGAVLAGIPTVTLDPGAMAWPVASHALAEAPVRPERAPWAHDLAWTQWTLAEIASGDAWAAVGPLAGLPAPPAAVPAPRPRRRMGL